MEMRPDSKTGQDELLQEVKQLKALFILLLLKLGTSSSEIALIKGIGASTVRRDFPAGEIRKFVSAPSAAGDATR